MKSTWDTCSEHCKYPGKLFDVRPQHTVLYLSNVSSPPPLLDFFFYFRNVDRTQIFPMVCRRVKKDTFFSFSGRLHKHMIHFCSTARFCLWSGQEFSFFFFKMFLYPSISQRLADQCLLSLQHIPQRGRSAFGQPLGLSLHRSYKVGGEMEWCNTWHMVVVHWASV